MIPLDCCATTSAAAKSKVPSCSLESYLTCIAVSGDCGWLTARRVRCWQLPGGSIRVRPCRSSGWNRRARNHWWIAAVLDVWGNDSSIAERSSATNQCWRWWHNRRLAGQAEYRRSTGEGAAADTGAATRLRRPTKPSPSVRLQRSLRFRCRGIPASARRCAAGNCELAMTLSGAWRMPAWAR